MEFTLPQIKTLLHALEVAAQKYKEMHYVEQHQVNTVFSYKSGLPQLVEPHAQAMLNCELAIENFKKLEEDLKKRYQMECDKIICTPE